MANPRQLGDLLAWEGDDGDTYVAQTTRLFAIIFRWAGRRGYHWEIFVDGEVRCYGQARTLHSAIAHVEGNCIGRGFISKAELP